MRDPSDPGTSELPLDQTRVGYARVSTDDQQLGLQRDALDRARCAVVYEDTASGKNTNRPELAQCLKSLRNGDTLVVWRLDRLSRSLTDLVHVVASLEAAGVAFESLTEKIDTSNAAGKLTFHLFAALAEFERNLIRERTYAGLAAARARGRSGGRPKTLTPKHGREIQQLLANPEITVKDVATRYNVGTATVYRYLNRAKAEQDANAKET